MFGASDTIRFGVAAMETSNPKSSFTTLRSVDEPPVAENGPAHPQKNRQTTTATTRKTLILCVLFLFFATFATKSLSEFAPLFERRRQSPKLVLPLPQIIFRND